MFCSFLVHRCVTDASQGNTWKPEGEPQNENSRLEPPFLAINPDFLEGHSEALRIGIVAVRLEECELFLSVFRTS